MVQVERCNRRTPKRRFSCDLMASPSKMICPVIKPGVKKRNGRLRLRINRRESLAFAKIASRTSQRQVVWRWSTAGRQRNDMLDVKRGHLQRLMHAAVFAAIRCP